MSAAQPVIELCDYTLAAQGSGRGLTEFNLSLMPGEVCAVESTHPDDAYILLRALATMIRPLKGAYLFSGETIDIRDYRATLKYKRRIGYIAPDAALISNMTIRQNLLLSRYYLENRLKIDLPDEVLKLCATFGISDLLDKRAGGLNSFEIQAAIVVRELNKKPRLLLMNQPESFIGHSTFDFLVQLFGHWTADQSPIVFLSYDRRLVRRYANRKITIADGTLSKIELKNSIDTTITAGLSAETSEDMPSAQKEFQPKG